MPINKQIHSYREVQEKIIKAVDIIANPVRQTLSPRGRNVIFMDDKGQIRVTNDGVTIAKSISLKDPIDSAIVDIVKYAALKTNAVAGDGTTTSVLLSQRLIQKGFRLIENGWNPMMLKRQLEAFAKDLIKQIKSNKYVKRIKNQKELEYVAKISSNNDEEVSANVIVAVNKAGKEGIILLEENPNHKEETEVVHDEGFQMEDGMFFPVFSNMPQKIGTIHKDVPILVTDKRIYYPQEAIKIMDIVANQLGHRSLVIVARDFIGQAPNVFATNHIQKKIQILLVKDSRVSEKNSESLEDLVSYLGCPLVTEKRGSLIDNLRPDDFGIAKRVMSDQKKTLILRDKNKPDKELRKRIAALQTAVVASKDESEKGEYEKRISYLTSGLVTIYIGARTPIEGMEKTYRYEDAVNSTRHANKDGYIIGGGLTLWNAFQDMDKSKYDSEVVELMRKYCLAPLEQIAENCDLHFPTMLSKVKGTIGYNALTGKYMDLAKAGVIEPVIVLEKSVENSVSVANVILSSGHIIVLDNDSEDKDKK